MKNYNEKIAILLKKLGVNPANAGWTYIYDAVDMVMDNPKNLRGITKVIYPEIAKRYGFTATRVERAIRHSIEVSFATAPEEVLELVFGNTVAANYKATNAQFIATVAEVITCEPDNPIWSA